MMTTRASHNEATALCPSSHCGPQSMPAWSVLSGKPPSAIPQLPELKRGEAEQRVDIKDIFFVDKYQAQLIVRSRPTPIVRWHVDTLNFFSATIPANRTGYPLLIQRLNALRKLDADWDGSGAASPRHKSITGAVLFTEILMQLDGIIAPKAMPLPTGNISLYWSSPSWYIEIEFIDTQTYDYYVEDFNGTHSFGNTSEIYPIDLKLLEVIEHFFRQS